VEKQGRPLLPCPPFSVSSGCLQARPAGSGVSVCASPALPNYGSFQSDFIYIFSVCVGGGANLILGSSGVPRRGDVGGLRGQGGANLTLFSGDSFVQVSKFWPETSRDDSQTLLHSWAPAPLQLRASALLTSPWRAGSPYFSLVRLHLWAPSGVPESWDLEW
jgi:hypothetical protein